MKITASTIDPPSPSVVGLVCTLVPSLITSLSLLLLYISYLSLFTLGQTFLHFQVLYSVQCVLIEV